MQHRLMPVFTIRFFDSLSVFTIFDFGQPSQVEAAPKCQIWSPALVFEVCALSFDPAARAECLICFGLLPTSVILA
jgi:hypothetical protein